MADHHRHPHAHRIPQRREMALPKNPGTVFGRAERGDHTLPQHVLLFQGLVQPNCPRMLHLVPGAAVSEGWADSWRQGRKLPQRLLHRLRGVCGHVPSHSGNRPKVGGRNRGFTKGSRGTVSRDNTEAIHKVFEVHEEDTFPVSRLLRGLQRERMRKAGEPHLIHLIINQTLEKLINELPLPESRTLIEGTCSYYMTLVASSRILTCLVLAVWKQRANLIHSFLTSVTGEGLYHASLECALLNSVGSVEGSALPWNATPSVQVLVGRYAKCSQRFQRPYFRISGKNCICSIEDESLKIIEWLWACCNNRNNNLLAHLLQLDKTRELHYTARELRSFGKTNEQGLEVRSETHWIYIQLFLPKRPLSFNMKK